jgi:hypothetical protein
VESTYEKIQYKRVIMWNLKYLNWEQNGACWGRAEELGEENEEMLVKGTEVSLVYNEISLEI